MMSAENMNTRQKWRGIAAGDPSFHPAECQGIRKENQTPQQAVMGYWRWGLPLRSSRQKQRQNSVALDIMVAFKKAWRLTHPAHTLETTDFTTSSFYQNNKVLAIIFF